jgi:hypothetical protein
MKYQDKVKRQHTIAKIIGVIMIIISAIGILVNIMW